MQLYLKLAVGNVRRSARDYSVYFATLGFAACLLYSFVASTDHLRAMGLSPEQLGVLGSAGDILQAFSVFTVLVFLFLVRYANRFLLRRRKREFALYELMGMGRGATAFVLIAETALVGACALALGIALGGALSPAFGAIAAFVFNVSWRPVFAFSAGSAFWTAGCFSVIFALNALDGARNMTKPPSSSSFSPSLGPPRSFASADVLQGLARWRLRRCFSRWCGERACSSPSTSSPSSCPWGLPRASRPRSSLASVPSTVGRSCASSRRGILERPARVHRAAGRGTGLELVDGPCVRVCAHRGGGVHDGGRVRLQRGTAHTRDALQWDVRPARAHRLYRHLLRVGPC